MLALGAGVSLRVVDVAVDHSPDAPAPDSPLAPDPRYRVGAGTGASTATDALTDDETERAVDVGRALADEEVDAGADLLVPGAIGVGATTPASVLVAAITGAEPVAVVGRGSGIDDEAWMRKAAAIRDALRRARPHARDPLALLRVAGGADLAVLAGFLRPGRGAPDAGAARRPRRRSPPRWSPTSWPPARATGGCSPSAPPSRRWRSPPSTWS